MTDNCKTLKMEFIKCLRDLNYDSKEIKYFSLPYKYTSQNKDNKLNLGDDVIKACKGDRLSNCIKKRFKVKINEEKYIDEFGKKYDEKIKLIEKENEEIIKKQEMEFLNQKIPSTDDQKPNWSNNFK